MPEMQSYMGVNEGNDGIITEGKARARICGKRIPLRYNGA